MLALVAALALAQTPQPWLFRQPNLPRGQSLAFFEFAPLSGAGMGEPCACSVVFRESDAEADVEKVKRARGRK